MKVFISRIFMFRFLKGVFFLCILFSYSFKFYADRVFVDGVVATVNDLPILYSDIKNVSTAMKYNGKNEDKKKNDEDIEVDILNNLIEQNLVISTNTSVSIEKEEKMIKDGIKEQAYSIFDKYFHNNEEAFIKGVGCGVEDYIKIGIEMQKQQMLYARIIDEMIKKENFSHEEVINFYKKAKEFNILPIIKEYYEICELVLLKKSDDTIRKEVIKIQRRLVRENFDDVIKDISKMKNVKVSVDKDWNQLNDMNEKFELVVFGLKKGEISSPFKIDDEYYIVRLDDRDKKKYKTTIVSILDNVYSTYPQEAIKLLKKIRDFVINGKLTWDDAVNMYSQNLNITPGGQILSKEGSYKISKEDLNLNLRNILKNMKEGDISDPFVDKDDDGKKYKIIYLKKHVLKHQANLEEDYDLIKNLAKSEYRKVQIKEIVEDLYKYAKIELSKKFIICDNYLKKYGNYLRKN